jgi:transcriptional regulator with PAS, ATPase and Fis domain
MTVEATLLSAIEELAGAVMVLDGELRVLAATPEAERLVGAPIENMARASALLCGDGPERPVAEALAEGRPVSAYVHRPGPGDVDRVLRVRATPLTDGGYVLLLDDQGEDSADGIISQWGITTRDPSMRQLLRDIEKVGRSESSVLVRGETGSGKELVARALHEASPRAEGPFRAINCAALPPSLLESTLFGHVRGAFTGAVRDEPGQVRLAHGGTLFLDEVAEIPLDLQAKLLRVLQEQTVIPVGGRDPVAVDVRFISATHQALRVAVAEGRFRADLMYRLRVIPLYLPPLRERRGDVALLANRFVAELGARFDREVERITPGALAALEDYDWPGNVRELRNAIEYAFVMGEGSVITDAELPPEVRGEHDGTVPKVNAPEAGDPSLPAEARRIVRALERSGGHHGRAAAALGMSRTTLWRRLKKYGLEAD